MSNDLTLSMRCMISHKINRIDSQIIFLKHEKPADYTQAEYDELLISLNETRNMYELKLKNL